MSDHRHPEPVDGCRRCDYRDPDPDAPPPRPRPPADVPPLRGPGSTPAGRAAALERIRAELAARRQDTQP